MTMKNLIKKVLEKYLLKGVDIMSFKESVDLVELPVVTFYQGNKKLNFLLDTGSNNCIIDKNIVDTIEHEILNMTSNLFGMEGNKQRVNVCRIKMFYKENEYEYEYLIQDMKAAFDAIKQETGVTLHGILGSKFFNKFRYVLDFAELIAYSKK